MPEELTDSPTRPIYIVKIKGQLYRTTVSDPYTPLFLALINLNSYKVNSILSQLQVKIVLDGKQLFPSPHGNTPEFVNRLLSLFSRLPFKKTPGKEVGKEDKSYKVKTEGRSYQVSHRRGGKKEAI